MTDEHLANFIWLGNRLVNVNQIAQFTISDNDTRVCALLSGVPKEDAEVVVEGTEASILIEKLRRVKRMEAPYRPFAGMMDKVVLSDKKKR